MSLIKCPDCGRDVSSLAPACVGCGRPFESAAGGPNDPRTAVSTPVAAPAGAGPETTLWQGRPSATLMILRTLVRSGLALAIGPGVLFALHRAALTVSPDSHPALRFVLEWYRTGNHAALVPWVVIGLAALIVVRTLAQLLHALRGTLGRHYRVTTQRIVMEKGILSKEIDELDLRVVDDTRLHQSFLERLVGIGQVEILSADKTESDLVLSDVANPKQLREIIRGQAYSISQRQLFTRPA